MFNTTVCRYKLIFPNFLAGNSVILFNIFWNVSQRFSDRCHFIYSTFSCLKTVNTAASKFYVFNCLTISVFDKS